MSGLERVSRARAVGGCALLIAATWLVPACAKKSPTTSSTGTGSDSRLTMMSMDDAPIRVKNHELEVDLLSKDPGDVWDPLPQAPGHEKEHEFQPKNSQRKHDNLVLVAIKSDGTWCEDRPYLADTIRIFYGNPANHTANTKPTVRIRVHMRKVKVNWIDVEPSGDGSKALKYDQTGAFMYRVEASGRDERDDFTPCTTDNPDTKIFLQLFEVNEELQHRRH